MQRASKAAAAEEEKKPPPVAEAVRAYVQATQALLQVGSCVLCLVDQALAEAVKA